MFKRVIYLLTVLLWAISTSLKANVDSLKYQLMLRPNDSIKIHIYAQLFDELRDVNHKDAKQYAYMGISLASQSNNQKMLSRLYHNLGTLYYVTAEYPMALQCYLRALKIREELNDSANIAKSYNNIGLVYFEEKNHVEALQFHLKSIAIKQKLGDKYGLASSYGNIGNIYLEWAKEGHKDSAFAKSLEYQMKSRKLQEELVRNNPNNSRYMLSLSATYNNIGNIYLEMVLKRLRGGNLNKSLEFHEKALEIQLKINDVRGMGHSYVNIGGINARLGQYEEAKKYYDKAIAIANEYELKETVKAAYEAMASMYESSGDLKNSLKYFKKFNSLKDSILDVTKAEQIAEMQVKFDAEKQAKEIELLNKNEKLKDEELKRQTLLRNSFIVGFLLVIALVLILYNRYRLKLYSSKQLEAKNKVIESKNKDITDSIKYAKRIQEAILPEDEYIRSLFSNHFVLYKPKDIVSGDFYWVDEMDGRVYFAAVDCTGHGVPGAFISIVGYNLLKHAIHEHKKIHCNDILDQVNNDITEALKQKYNESSVQDGMDLSLCCYYKNEGILEFAGANNSIYLARKKPDGFVIEEIKADKQPIGLYLDDKPKPFKLNTLEVSKGDTVFLFTDGYADQFGGKDFRKFKYKQLEQTFLRIAGMGFEQQREELNRVFQEWKGDYDQIDDILIMGIEL